jgi:hypothetical protein
MKNKGIAFILTILILASMSCTKYEDGPIITFRSKETRLSGTWKYQSIIDMDQNIEVTDNLPQTLYTYEKDGTYSESTGNYGTWKFSGAVDLVITDSTQSEIKWEIIKLANKQLWLRLDRKEHHFIPE